MDYYEKRDFEKNFAAPYSSIVFYFIFASFFASFLTGQVPRRTQMELDGPGRTDLDRLELIYFAVLSNI